MSMGRIAIAISLALLVSVTAWALGRPDQHPDRIELQAPEWMRAKPPAAAPASADRIEVPLPEPSASAEIANATNMAGALEAAKVPVQFQVKTLVDSGLAQDIVDGMSKAVEGVVWEREFLLLNNGNKGTILAMEYLLATWPDLGGLITSGRVVPKIVRIPEGSKVPRQVVWFYEKTPKPLLEACINTENGWQVLLPFSEATNHNLSLFQQVVEAHKQ